ncbi:MAG: glycoside hydrolase family 3 [Ruminococcus sp.]|nr:glycoside hydrolase family 3 [Ruminococcus sp.]
MKNNGNNQKSSGGFLYKLMIFVCIIALIIAAGAGFVFIREIKNSEKEKSASPSGTTLKSDDKTADIQDITEESTTGNIVDNLDQYDRIISKMSLHEKICQMFIVTPESLTGFDVVTASGDTTKNCLKQYPVGGLIYFAANLESMEQAKEMLSGAKGIQKNLGMIPMFYAIDEEGGDVARCADALGTTSFDPMYLYKEMGTDTAYSNAKTIAGDISSVGFNLDFAPVADTWSNPANTVIGQRAYSDDFAETAELVAAAVKGFSDGGVYCSVKHFPGHGDTAEDSHYGTAVSAKTLAELEQNEYLAFKKGIEAGADMVMMGHITMTSVDQLPASVSKTMITDELRGKLGYDGVVITDSLAMGAVTEMYESGELAVKIVDAGADMLLMPQDMKAAVEALEKAVEDGTITEERINESIRRILILKSEKMQIE